METAEKIIAAWPVLEEKDFLSNSMQKAKKQIHSVRINGH